MLTVRHVPLPDEARRVLGELIAADPAPAAGLWSRLKAAATPDRKFRAALLRGRCEDVEIRHDAPPALSAHEHGLFLFVPAGADATLLLDVSYVSDDVRWPLHRAGQLLRQRWRWLRIAGLEGPWCFAAEGAPATPRDLGEFHGTALERRLTEEMGWPGDDAILPLALSEIERLARQRSGAVAA